MTILRRERMSRDTYILESREEDKDTGHECLVGSEWIPIEQVDCSFWHVQAQRVRRYTRNAGSLPCAGHREDWDQERSSRLWRSCQLWGRGGEEPMEAQCYRGAYRGSGPDQEDMRVLSPDRWLQYGWRKAGDGLRTGSIPESCRAQQTRGVWVDLSGRPGCHGRITVASQSAGLQCLDKSSGLEPLRRYWMGSSVVVEQESNTKEALASRWGQCSVLQKVSVVAPWVVTEKLTTGLNRKRDPYGQNL